ncbi:MAG: hypothetical protein JXB38_17720 [Anaerolineales bacterium]|nr:hypothetical protein [Anaerolineales bacterium]
MELLFDRREIMLFHPMGSVFNFPLMRGDIIRFNCWMSKMPAYPEFNETVEDIRWGADFLPYWDDTYSSIYSSFYRLRAHVVYPRKETYILGCEADHENDFFAYAVGDQFDLYTEGPHINMLVSVLAIVTNIWSCDEEFGKSYIGDLRAYGREVGDLIAQEIDVLDTDLF